MRKTKVSTAHRRLQAVFGTQTGFKFARLCHGCITHGQYFKKGDAIVEMDKETFEKLGSEGYISESVSENGLFFLRI